VLADAFERHTVAAASSTGCKIGDTDVDCPKAMEFISEHMKN
jgi:hypothetical protein